MAAVTERSTETKKLKNKARASLALLLIAVISISTATYAWFTLSNSTSVQSMIVEVSTGVNLRAMAGSSTSTTMSDYYALIKADADAAQGNGDQINTGLVSVTKLSEVKLWPLTSSDGATLITQSSKTVDATTKYYVELELTFLADTDMRVYLNGENSKTNPTENEKDSTLVSPVDSTKSADINTVNSLRISFTEKDSTNGVIYEPGGADAASGQTTFNTLGTNKGLEGTTPLFTLVHNTPKVIVVRMWAEGNDPQCTNDPNAINIEKGQVNVRFRFCGADTSGNFIETPTT